MIDSRIYEKILEIKREGGEAVLVTVVEKLSEGPARLGAKMLVLPDGERIGTVGGGALELSAVRKALEFMKDKKSGTLRYNLNAKTETEQGEVHVPMVCGGKVILFFEYLSSGPKLYVFGAGNVGREVAELAAGCGFFVTVIDPSKTALSQLVNVQKKLESSYIEAFEKLKPAKAGFYFISTLSHKSDAVVLEKLLAAEWEPAFVGMLASAHKTREVLELVLQSLPAEKVDPDVFYSPVGLDIGGDTPQEIAVSAVAQMQAIRYGRPASPPKSVVRQVLDELKGRKS